MPSLEDFLFGFGVVGLGGSLPFFLLKRELPEKGKGRGKQLLMIAAGAALVMLVLTSVLKVNSIFSSYVIFAGLVIFALLKWPTLWRAMLTSGVALAVLGSLTCGLVSLTITSGYSETVYLLDDAPVFFGFLPLTEIIWFIGWGATAAALPYLTNNPAKGL